MKRHLQNCIKLIQENEALEDKLGTVEYVNTRALDYQKEEIDKKNEELLRLTRKLYHMEEELNSCKERIARLEEKTEDQTELIMRLPQQLHFSEDRYKEKCEHQIICMQYEKQKAAENVKKLFNCQFERDDAKEKVKSLQSDASYLRNKFTRVENRKCLKCDVYERKLSEAKQDYQELQDKIQEEMSAVKKRKQHGLEMVIKALELENLSKELVQQAEVCLDPELLARELENCSLQEENIKTQTKAIVEALEKQPTVERHKIIRLIHDRCDKGVSRVNEVNVMNNENERTIISGKHTSQESHQSRKEDISSDKKNTFKGMKDEKDNPKPEINHHGNDKKNCTTCTTVNKDKRHTINSNEVADKFALGIVGGPKNEQLEIEGNGGESLISSS